MPVGRLERCTLHARALNGHTGSFHYAVPDSHPGLVDKCSRASLYDCPALALRDYDSDSGAYPDGRSDENFYSASTNQHESSVDAHRHRSGAHSHHDTNEHSGSKRDPDSHRNCDAD